jgi:hypothetical protein
MSKASTKKLLDKMIETKYQENQFFYDEPVRPMAGQPATDAELMQLERYCTDKGFDLPAAYREALSVYNGVELLFGPFLSLLSIKDVIGDHEVIDEMEEEYPGCTQFIIGAGSTGDIVAFDVGDEEDEEDEDGGEDEESSEGYPVVWITGDASVTRWKNFKDFLTKHTAVLERNVRAQKKDRAGLKP